MDNNENALPFTIVNPVVTDGCGESFYGIEIPAKEISRLGRATQGVKIMNVGEDVNIIALAKVIKEDELDAADKEDGEDDNPQSDDGQEQMKL